MTKKYFFSTFAALALGFVVSCDNTTDDPPNHNTDNSGGSTITGPRILSKVTTGTKDTEEYITTIGGALAEAYIREAGSTNTIAATLTYTGDKITKIKYQDNVNPHVVDNLYTITYTNGKMSAISMDQTAMSTTNHSDFSVFYDANGQLYRIVEKKKMGGSATYTHYVEYKFTFSASNVVSLDKTSMLMSGGNPDTSTASVMTYAYDNFDGKINPYTTLPKEYFMVTGTLFPINFYMLSTNNVGKITIHSPGSPAVLIPKGYLYDSQNYPVSDQSQAIKYVYKPL
ncbi:MULTISPECIES: hypothetical protein [Chryseobacterium]|uniref:YD repeat-containing protein n=1 Tax=Chryseobacterium geocarposphaerae TaxID=1416776 RepID=A0ABU1LF81_9FLAO|nr:MULTISPECIES: hypothetical protein [Chryseobacterium]MDR6405381.1 hypothetical protein [Chryseobacterium geocarposphaerae]MDR6697540.1 hypothetical protein [Chryseobacterium ginsenosidimutans]